ncbi:MAG: hypothetical protein M1829_003712 [Trizodia sp. TS-e1964]|nr:MAG: hypothetical protein M1829_003712 [Trizodia sp. TS-e1964]
MAMNQSYRSRGSRDEHLSSSHAKAPFRLAGTIDPNRPQELTPEESLSVNQDPVVRRLVAEREKWKRRFQGTATQQPGYGIIGRAIFNTRQRLRAALLKYLQERWDPEHPGDEIERQLSALKLSQDVKTTLDQNNEMPLLQKRLAEAVMTLPGTTLFDERPSMPANIPSYQIWSAGKRKRRR